GLNLTNGSIVLVAGLGGHPLRTWQAADDTLWPRDLLPDYVSDIRVLSFNYNTTLKGSATQAGIREHAEELLMVLQNAKEDNVDALIRPVVFVGHSLGGLIIKHALYLAERKLDSKYKWLWEASRGVMFFSTPHYGMDKAQWRMFVRYVLQYDAPYQGAVPTEGMLVDVWDSADALVNISENFEPLQQYLAFETFVENKAMKGIGEPVNRIGRRGKKALYALCSDEVHSQSLNKKPTPDTCSWLEEIPEFKNWWNNEAGKQNLWITGPPACGKSYLAKHIIGELGPSASGEIVHCFLDGSLPDRGDLDSVLRATMHQALRLEPEIINDYLPPKSETEEGKMQPEDMWKEGKLRSLWPEIMGRVTARHPMTVVIDGFDELQTDDRKEFFNCLGQLEDMSTNPQNLKSLLLSREIQDVNPETAGNSFGRYNVKPTDTATDMRKSIDEGLGNVWATRRFGNRNLQNEICDKIQTHSDGVYLSATMITEDLIRNRDVKSGADMLSLLGSPTFPQSLTGIYDVMIDRISKKGSIADLLKQALLWAAFQREGLRPAEFNIAQAVGRAMEKHPNRKITRKELQDFLDDNSAITLEFHCGHLVRFQSGRLELVHKSLRTYLMMQDDGGERSEATLASICVTYLGMPQFQESGLKADYERMDLWESKVRKRVDSHKFVRYASLYWNDHICGAGRSWPAVVTDRVAENQALVEDSKTGYAESWTEVWWYFTMWPGKNFP
ncbi:hypothetical protein B0H67DRAFT_457434, partial [Lasiosphaeris hirsuta]